MASHLAYDQNGQRIDTSLSASQNGSMDVNSAGNQGSMFGNADDYKAWLIEQAGKGNTAAQDKIGSYYLGEESNQTAREWTAGREDTAYQRMVKDARAAGINPMALLATGGSPQASSSSGHSYNNGEFESKRHNETNESKGFIIGIISALAIIAAAAL